MRAGFMHYFESFLHQKQDSLTVNLSEAIRALLHDTKQRTVLLSSARGLGKSCLLNSMLETTSISAYLHSRKQASSTQPYNTNLTYQFANDQVCVFCAHSPTPCTRPSRSHSLFQSHASSSSSSSPRTANPANTSYNPHSSSSRPYVPHTSTTTTVTPSHTHSPYSPSSHSSYTPPNTQYQFMDNTTPSSSSSTPYVPFASSTPPHNATPYSPSSHTNINNNSSAQYQFMEDKPYNTSTSYSFAAHTPHTAPNNNNDNNIQYTSATAYSFKDASNTPTALTDNNKEFQVCVTTVKENKKKQMFVCFVRLVSHIMSCA